MKTIFTDTLQEAFEQVGYEFPHINGAAITRFSTNGKNGDKAGWLKVFADGDGAAFGCWRSNEQYTWQRKRDQATPMTQAEVEALRARHKAAQAEAEREREEGYQAAAIRANEFINGCSPAESHPYLASKQIAPHGALLHGTNLVIPVRGADGIQSYQTIDLDGNKLFMKGGKMSGGFFRIGEPTERIIVCEGFATGATLHSATSDMVVVAFNAGNLKAVAQHVRSRFPEAQIVVAADDDVGDHNTGVLKATEAAKAANAVLALPRLGNSLNHSKTDFNDMAIERGEAAVAQVIDAAFGVAPSHNGYMSAEDLSKRQRLGWRIKDMVPRKGLCVVWGPPGSGKSFFVLDMACAVARGLPDYHGKRIRPGVVVYLAMEGNLQDRVEAYRKENNLPAGALNNLVIKHSTVDFMDPDSVRVECAAIKDFVGDREVAMVVIDTLARSMPGGNENGSEHMGAVIGGYKLVEDYFQTCVLPLHHCGKNVDNGMRGHSSLLGAIDAEIEIKRNGDDPIRTLHVGKQKDGQDHYDLFNFRLPRVVLGLTSRWDPDAGPYEEDSSCVVQVTTEDPTNQKAERTTKNGNLMQRAVENCRVATGDIRREDVRTHFYLLHEGTAEAKKKAFDRDWKKFMNSACSAVNQANADRDI